MEKNKQKPEIYEIFDHLLEFSDMSSVFKVLARTEYIVLGKILKASEENEANGGRVYLEDIKSKFATSMSKVSELVRVMSDEGLLSWNLDSKTKKTYVTVTEMGKDRCERQKQGMVKISNRLEQEITDEDKTVFLNVVKKSREVLEEEQKNTKAMFDVMLGKKESSMNILSLLKPKSFVTYVEDSKTIREVIDVLKESGFASIPVINKQGIYLGTISDGDILWYIDEYGMEDIDNVSISDIVNTKRNPAVHDMVDSREIMGSILKQNFLCMVDDRECFIGIITRKDIMGYFEEEIEKRNKA